MASGKIKRATGDSTSADITGNFDTSQSYYHVPNNDTIKYFRNNNVVVVNGTITVDSPYTSYPGTPVLAGLPAPSDPVTLSIPAFGSLDTTAPLWMRVTTDGHLNLRYGTVSKSYNMNFTYICK